MKMQIIHRLGLTALMNMARHNQKFLSLIDIRPKWIEIAVTNKCNFKCIMCDYWKLDSHNELTTNETKSILNQAKNVGVEECLLYGGEPMLREDIFELIEYAHGLNLNVGMTSNGYLINETNARKLFEKGLRTVTISIDAIGDVHDKVRGTKGAFGKAISAAVHCRQNRIKVTIAALLMKPTLENRNIIHLVNSLDNLGFPVFIQLLDLSSYYFKNNALKEKLWIKGENLRELDKIVDDLVKIKKRKQKLIVNTIPSLEHIKGYFRDPKRKDIPCYLMYWGRIWVDSRGRLYICQALPPIADLRKVKLQNVLLSNEYKKRLQRAFMKQCPGCSCGYSINVHLHLPIMRNYFFSNPMLFLSDVMRFSMKNRNKLDIVPSSVNT